jgi:hypothetical protein
MLIILGESVDPLPFGSAVQLPHIAARSKITYGIVFIRAVAFKQKYKLYCKVNKKQRIKEADSGEMAQVD